MIPVELISMIASGVGGFLMKQSAQKTANQQKLLEMVLLKNKNQSDLADVAAKRSSPFVRKVVALFVIAICYGSLVAVAFFPDIPVSIIEDPQEHSLLWGLIAWTKTNVIVADGLVYPDWVRYSICSIIGFLFGTGASKTY